MLQAVDAISGRQCSRGCAAATTVAAKDVRRRREKGKRLTEPY